MGDANSAGFEQGMIFLEGRIREFVPQGPEEGSMIKFARGLEAVLSNPNNVFEVGQDLLDGKDEINSKLLLGRAFDSTQLSLYCLKVVEYQGPLKAATRPLICCPTADIHVDVKLYLLHTDPLVNIEDTFPQAQTALMPNLAFQDTWSRLVFDSDIKEDLIWMMQNIIKHQSSATDLNRIVLLHGPPGTGKTSLCQGLAQKMSIRLSSTYTHTRLIQINTSTLLSKYYSESAKIVDDIFHKITLMCNVEPKHFFCIMIDEVESIAGSREFSTIHGESQDSLRATNALLTGFDRCQNLANVMFLCTSNLFDALDPAFVDRCGVKVSLDPPSEKSQYEILRQRIQRMIDNKVVESELQLPAYDDAILESYSNPRGGGSQLRNLVAQIQVENERCRPGKEITGRTLIQLPMQAVMRYNRSPTCSLDTAFKHMEKLIHQSRPTQFRTPSTVTLEKSIEKEVATLSVTTRQSLGKKRRHLELEGLGADIQTSILDALASAGGKRLKVSLTIDD